jgi:alkanesulfonate monooxygenase SsuD/methylene tetrahydromethanopterin reductase-like flavin-dependent oxidoreductase (luciferase family)
MDLGVCYFPTDYGIDMSELGRALEDRGFKSLYLPEHTHIPLSRRTPFPGGGELPKRYSHTHDPFVALSFAAAVTKKLKLGTGILLVQLSGGRFVFGIGGGWNVDEMENHGATHANRFKIMREHVLAMKALWTEEKASYHGEFVKFDPVWSWPKPTQKPNPPILLGGETDHTLRRIIEYCDGWLPRPRGFDPVQGIERLHRMASEKKRDPKTLSVTVFGAPADSAVLASYAKSGIDGALLAIPDVSRDEILRQLDQWAPLAKAHA